MRRREFIRLLGARRNLAAFPACAAAGNACDRLPPLQFGAGERKDLEAFRKGLSETGYVEGRDVEIEFRCLRTLRHLAAAH